MSMMGLTSALIFIYFTGVWVVLSLLHKVKKSYVNISFVLLNILFFLALNVYYYKTRDNFSFMTFDNISPFTFTFMPAIFILGKKTKNGFLSAIAFLSVGMFGAMLITPQHAYLFSFATKAGFDYLFDALCHLNCSLFGIYLVASGQIKLTYKNLVSSTIFMYSVITFGVIMNYLFHTSNFGMNPYGGFSIYMIDIFEEFWATLLAYYVGVFLVLSIGFGFNYLANKLNGNDKAFHKVVKTKNIFLDEMEKNI